MKKPSYPRSQRLCGRSIFGILLGLVISAGFLEIARAQITSGKIIKWDQPPALATPTNVFWGWNQESVYGRLITADDWLCTNSEPITSIRWWGSFIGWAESGPPAVLPAYWRIQIWTDNPPNQPPLPQPWSHPNQVVYDIIVTNVPFQCVGLDYHNDGGACPTTKTPSPSPIETCYQWQLNLSPNQYFLQTGPSNIFWISISAGYTNPITAVPFPFGIKTRPRDPLSPAPDAAVSIKVPNNPVLLSVYVDGFPLVCPEPFLPEMPSNQWDLAFELGTGIGGGDPSKWEQVPDLTQAGIDVDATFDPQLPPPILLASDFLCQSPGFITNIVIWGSWSNDIVPFNDLGIPDPLFVQFTLSIHADIPASGGPTGTNYSRPGQLLWTATFPPHAFNHAIEASNILEGWLRPPANYVFPGDRVCHRYEFNLPAAGQEPFFQQGTAASNRVYWLDVQAQIVGSQPFPRPRFGWKTCITNWNDDAVWAPAVDTPPGPLPGAWGELHYPPVHPKAGQSIDLAFRLNTGTGGPGTQGVKWSQPPVVYLNPTNLYNGWNEPSIFGGGLWNNIPLTNIVADDWLCTNARPVTDIHWWGSFLNWRGAGFPPQPPVAFHFTIWRDVPQGPNDPFSHPGLVIWQFTASTTDPNLRRQWVGWDVDPRGDCPEVESCFKFDYSLPGTNSWFFQPPGTNVFWLSIAAIYPGGNVGQNPFGWKTRPHVPVPPDDAVRIFQPLMPSVGLNYISGEPIEFPPGTSWDMAFRLTTCQQYPLTNVVFTNIALVWTTNNPAQQVFTLKWNAQPGTVYQVQETVDLAPVPAVWADLGSPVIGPINSVTFTNPLAYPRRFYRLCLPDICP